MKSSKLISFKINKNWQFVNYAGTHRSENMCDYLTFATSVQLEGRSTKCELF